MSETEQHTCERTPITPLMIIHALPSSDAPILREMLYQAIHVSEDQPRPSREVLTEPKLAGYFENWGRDGDAAMIAIDAANEAIIGAAWFRLFSEDEPGYGFVDAATPEICIALLPEYRGQGIGSRLFIRLLEKAQSRFSAISLSVDPDNPALRLYQRFGFEQVGVNGTSLVLLKHFNKEVS